MTELTAETLKKILNNTPNDYIIRLQTRDGLTLNIKDNFEFRLTNKELILKEK